MRPLVTSLFLSLAATALPATADISTMKPGLWEYTMTMEMPGMPIAVPPTTYKHCLTQKDIEEGKQFQNGEKKGECQMTNMKQAGNKVSYDVECKGQYPTKGHFDLVTSENAMDGKGTMTTAGQTFTNQFKSRRIGDCKK